MAARGVNPTMCSMRRARFCLIMPFRNEARHLATVLDSIALQKVEASRVRLVAVDNGSTDGSGEIVEAWVRRTGFPTTILRVEEPSIPAALNAGIALAADDEIVVRLDAHTIYGEDYLLGIDDAFARLPPDVVCVGGSQAVADAEGFGGSLVAALMTNRMGLGGADFRTSSKSREVDSAYLGAWRPGILSAFGGYDERWRANEDAELAARIREAGGRVWFVPLSSRYQITRGPLATLVQWRRYGFWRARTILRHPRTLRLRHLAPPLALFAALALLISPLRATLLLPALAFAALVILFRDPDESPLVTAASIVYFPAAHAAFAIGLLTGVFGAPLRPIRTNRSSESERAPAA